MESRFEQAVGEVIRSQGAIERDRKICCRLLLGIVPGLALSMRRVCSLLVG